jgi:catechol 2,3-dioxygenase-like lactoylglutathione lyase family enzyme
MLSKQRIKSFISTAQPDKARNFYVEKLGLKVLSEDSFGIEFEAIGGRIRLTFVEKLTPQPFTVLGWDTSDINSEVRFLNERGITFERYASIVQDSDGIWTAPGGSRIAWFRDPDGNILSLSE